MQKNNKFIARFFHDKKNGTIWVKARNKQREFKLQIPASPEIMNDMRGCAHVWFKIEMVPITGTKDYDMLIRGRTRPRNWAKPPPQA